VRSWLVALLALAVDASGCAWGLDASSSRHPRGELAQIKTGALVSAAFAYGGPNTIQEQSGGSPSANPASDAGRGSHHSSIVSIWRAIQRSERDPTFDGIRLR